MGIKVWIGPAMGSDAYPLGDDVLRNPTFADSEGVETLKPTTAFTVTGWTDIDGNEHPL
jgi:copper oxidase (laccase) domain-containing protein